MTKYDVQLIDEMVWVSSFCTLTFLHAVQNVIAALKLQNGSGTEVVCTGFVVNGLNHAKPLKWSIILWCNCCKQMRPWPSMDISESTS